jgi:hypothetical protein
MASTALIVIIIDTCVLHHRLSLSFFFSLSFVFETRIVNAPIHGYLRVHLLLSNKEERREEERKKGKKKGPQGTTRPMTFLSRVL